MRPGGLAPATMLQAADHGGLVQQGRQVRSSGRGIRERQTGEQFVFAQQPEIIGCLQQGGRMPEAARQVRQRRVQLAAGQQLPVNEFLQGGFARGLRRLLP